MQKEEGQSKYVKANIARIKNVDNAEAIAQKNERKASASIKQQLAALDAKVVDNEETLSEAEEALENALYPTKLIGEGKAYLENIANRQATVEEATKALEATKKNIEYFKKLASERF